MKIRTALECHPSVGDQLKVWPVAYGQLLPCAGLRAILDAHHNLFLFGEGWVSIAVRY